MSTLSKIIAISLIVAVVCGGLCLLFPRRSEARPVMVAGYVRQVDFDAYRVSTDKVIAQLRADFAAVSARAKRSELQLQQLCGALEQIGDPDQLIGTDEAVRQLIAEAKQILN